MMTQQKNTLIRNRGEWADRLKNLTGRNEETSIAVPLVDIFESDTEVLLEVEMPGVSKDTIQTVVHADTLEISGQAVVPDLPKEYTPLYSERSNIRYQRAFLLGAELQTDKIRAGYDNGLLKLVIPKVEKPKPRIITIE